MQFRIANLLTIVFWIAIVFALIRWHPAFSIVLCPMTLGPVAGRWASGTREGMVVGFLSALFWCVIASIFAGMLLISVIWIRAISGGPIETWTGFIIAMSLFYSLIGVIGGYVGGRVAIS